MSLFKKHFHAQILINSKTILFDINKHYHYKIPFYIIPLYDSICKLISLFFPIANRHYILVKLLYLARFRVQHTYLIWFLSTYSQKQHLLSNKNHLETLIYGSSHGLLGYKETTNIESNLSVPACDLYSMTNIFLKSYLLCPNLKRVILFISSFHGGYCLQNSFNAIVVSPILKTIWDINYNSRGKITLESLVLQNEFRTLLKLKRDSLSYSQEEIWQLYKKIIFQSRYSSTGDRLSKIKSEFHRSHKSYIQNCSKYTEAPYLNKILLLITQYNLRAYIVLPPYTCEYIAGLPAACLFRQIPTLFKNTSNVTVLDYSSDPDFSDSDFADLDHLTPIGAQKLTLKIHNAIRQTEGINYP